MAVLWSRFLLRRVGAILGTRRSSHFLLSCRRRVSAHRWFCSFLSPWSGVYISLLTLRCRDSASARPGAKTGRTVTLVPSQPSGLDHATGLHDRHFHNRHFEIAVHVAFFTKHSSFFSIPAEKCRVSWWCRLSPSFIFHHVSILGRSGMQDWPATFPECAQVGVWFAKDG